MVGTVTGIRATAGVVTAAWAARSCCCKIVMASDCWAIYRKICSMEGVAGCYDISSSYDDDNDDNDDSSCKERSSSSERMVTKA